MVSTSSISKKALVLLLALIFNFTSFHTAYAVSWNDIKAVAKAAGGSFSGSGNVGGAVRTAVAVVPWSSLKNGLKGGLGTALLGAAVYAALSATDYVLNPDNNSVTYKPSDADNCAADGSDCQSSQLIWSYNSKGFATAEAACSYYASFWSTSDVKYKNLGGGSYASSTSYNCNLQITGSNGTWTDNSTRVTASDNANYDPNANAEDKRQTITIPDLLQKLIDQTQAGNADSLDVLNKILNAALALAQAPANTNTDLKTMLATIIAALNSATTYDTTTAATGTMTNASTGEKTSLALDFPTFCGWAAITCEAAQIVIDFPTTLSTWRDTAIASVQEFVGDETNEDNTLDIDTTTNQSVNSSISFGGSCPSSQSVNVSFGGINQTINFDYTYFCDLASFIKPVILVLSSFAAALIVAGVRDSET